MYVIQNKFYKWIELFKIVLKPVCLFLLFSSMIRTRTFITSLILSGIEILSTLSKIAQKHLIYKTSPLHQSAIMKTLSKQIILSIHHQKL